MKRKKVIIETKNNNGNIIGSVTFHKFSKTRVVVEIKKCKDGFYFKRFYNSPFESSMLIYNILPHTILDLNNVSVEKTFKDTYNTYIKTFTIQEKSDITTNI